MNKLMLTFDVEDFINPNAIIALKTIIHLLNKYEIRAIFFITGHMVEKISSNDELVDLLNNHLIGFHSSSHSVRPIIIEYTDKEKYEQAYEETISRETSHIDWRTGEPTGEGGIHALQNIFYKHKIDSYRGPGDSWSAPHIDALLELGIKYNFSVNRSNQILFFNDVYYYPKSFTQEWYGLPIDYYCLIKSLLISKVSVFDIHPWWIVNKKEWDYLFWNGNPKKLVNTETRNLDEVNNIKKKFDKLLYYIKICEKNKILKITPNLGVQKYEIADYDHRSKFFNYDAGIRWAVKFFNYHPKYLKKHYEEYFDMKLS